MDNAVSLTLLNISRSNTWSVKMTHKIQLIYKYISKNTFFHIVAIEFMYFQLCRNLLVVQGCCRHTYPHLPSQHSQHVNRCTPSYLESSNTVSSTHSYSNMSSESDSSYNVASHDTHSDEPMDTTVSTLYEHKLKDTVLRFDTEKVRKQKNSFAPIY